MLRGTPSQNQRPKLRRPIEGMVYRMEKAIKYNDIYNPINPEELANIPEEMKQEPRWVCWGSTKVPVSVQGGIKGIHYGIDITKESNWGTFEQASSALGEVAYTKYDDEYFHIVGVGFVVGNGWFCADLDGGPGHGREDVPKGAIQAACFMQTYRETSLSGCGYHVFGQCNFDSSKAESNKPHRDENGDPVPESYEIEFFTRRKFIAITGRKIDPKICGYIDHINKGFSGNQAAWDFYESYILKDRQKDEEKAAAERAKRARNIGTTSPDDMTTFFLLNYPEILAASDSSNFKRGGPGVKLAPGEYSWIGALKAMQEIGVPEPDIMEWCQRGSNFKSENDVLKVLSKSGKPGASSVASLIEDAKAHGWKPDPNKLTGEYKLNHELKEYKEEQERNFRARNKDTHIKQLAALGIDCAGDPYKYTWTQDYDGSIDTVIEKESGEIVYKKPDEERAAVIGGMNVYQAKVIDKVPSFFDLADPWRPIVKGKALPKFPLEQFPAWVQNHIENYCAATGVNGDYCAAAVLGTISAVTTGHCDIPFNGDHMEPIQLYSVFVGDSGTMKSSVIRHFMKPANDWLRLKNAKALEANAAIKKEIEHIEKDISAEKKLGMKGNPEKIQELKAALEIKKEEYRIGYPVPYDDVTPESLLNAMKYSRGTANIATAEGNIINVICGRSYTQRGAVQNLDVFLKGADAEPIHNFRVTSGEIDIPRTDLSIMIGLQPSLLERLCSSADANGRGLTQRFLLYTPEETKKTIDHTATIKLDTMHMERWERHIQSIADRFMDPNSDTLTIELEPAADTVIRKFWNYETELLMERGPGDNETIISWIGKLHGKALRVAALLALLRDRYAEKITEEDAETAVFLFKSYYIPHFINSIEHSDHLTREQRTIVQRITKSAQNTGNMDYITEHDIWLYARQLKPFTGRDGRKAFDAALEDLAEMNYIRPGEPIKPESGRGRPAKVWQLNPAMFTE